MPSSDNALSPTDRSYFTLLNNLLYRSVGIGSYFINILCSVRLQLLCAMWLDWPWPQMAGAYFSVSWLSCGKGRIRGFDFYEATQTRRVCENSLVEEQPFRRLSGHKWLKGVSSCYLPWDWAIYIRKLQLRGLQNIHLKMLGEYRAYINKGI